MDFKDCLRRRIAKEVIKDGELISSLLKTSENKFISEKRLELNKITSASKISLLYDSLRELLEALALKNGFKIYNHECFTYFLKEILNENVKAEEFDDLRKIRNSVNYYGMEMSLDEAKSILKKLEDLRKKIKELIGSGK